MRASILAVLLAAAPVAIADPVVSVVDIPGASRQLTTVFAAADAKQLGAMFAAKLTVDGLRFIDRGCDKAFGKGKRRTIAKKKHAQLAACIVGANWLPTSDADDFSSDAAHYAVRYGTLDVTFAPGKDGVVRIAKLRLVEEVVQPVKIEKVEGDVNADDGWEEGGVADGVVGGEIGGVVGGVAAAPPPPPPPPPAPQNVPPTSVEALRLAGDKLIVPDDKTKEAIQKAGKDKIVASYKLCLSSNGSVTTVTQLKSSGFPDYDAKIKAGIKTWRYRPYVINGAPAPVCTAVTFIYAQK
jgi:hypothetical protein